MTVEQVFILIMGSALAFEGIRYTARTPLLLPYTTNISSDDRLGVTAMFGGVQLAAGLYVLCALLVFDAHISALLFLAILFGIVGIYRVVAFAISTVSRKQLWFGLVELAFSGISLFTLLAARA